MAIQQTEGVAASHIDDLPDALDGMVKLVRAELGISAFGVQVWDLPPDQKSLQEHDERGTGQEELYVALRGSGALLVNGDGFPLDAEHVVRVAPETKRAISTGPDGLRLLCVGGVPGAPYEAPEWSEVS